MNRITTTLLFLSGAFIAVAAAAQAPAPPTQQAPALRPQRPVQIRTNIVLVPVTVKDSHGQLVSDLTKNDFRIFEDNTERPINSFNSEPVPLSAVVLLDNDLAQKQAAQVQKSLSAVAAGFGPDDEVAFVTYDEYPTTVSDFSKDNDKLFTELKRTEIGSHSTFVYPDPTTAGPVSAGSPPSPPNIADQVKGPPKYNKSSDLDDAIFSAGQMLQDRGRDRRKIIFLISDGSNSRNNKHTFAETERMLLGADVAVYGILVNRTLPVGKALLQRGASAVDHYAADTGGDTYYGAKDDDLSRLYSDVTEEARDQYTLTFEPGSADTTHDYHSIEVRVLRQGLSVRTRDGYYMSAVVAGH
jgi:Ca-activated chloride channel family protein